MGWYNFHLHRLFIHGSKDHGMSYAGGVAFADDPAKSGFLILDFGPRSGSSINMTLVMHGN
jgi:hypothetical protein